MHTHTTHARTDIRGPRQKDPDLGVLSRAQGICIFRKLCTPVGGWYAADLTLRTLTSASPSPRNSTDHSALGKEGRISRDLWN